MSSVLSSVLENHSPREALVSVAAASVVAGAFLYAYSGGKRVSGKGTVIRPPHVFSWIPYLGSALDMGADVTKFIRTRAQQKNAPVFSAMIVGDKCVFIADPEYLTIVFKAKYSKYLDSLSLQKQFTKTVLGCSPQEVKENFGDEIDKITSKQFHHYLFKGEELQKSVEQVQGLFHKVVPELAGRDGGWTQHSLFDMVVRAIFKATMGPIFSPDLVTDELYEQFRIFDKGVIPLFNNAPNFLTDKARKARSFIQEKVQAPDFWDNASPFMKARKEAYVGQSLSQGCMNKSNLGLLWASVGNSAPAVFWTLLLLLEHEDAWNTCVAQMESIIAKRDDNKPNVFTLEELDEMTCLESAFKETLRLYQGNFTARRVVQDFVLETKDQKYVIEEGSKLMIWWGMLHRDPGVFDNPDTFQYDRFVGKNFRDFSFQSGKTLTHEPIIPFGGGEQLCPGRKFASYEARLYLAMLMQTFDIQLSKGESRPGIDPAMVGIGVCHPDRDVKVEIRPKGDLI